MRFPAIRIVLGSLIVAGALAAAGPIASASAHDALESSDPAADSSITADPGAVTLGFSDDLLSLGSSNDGFAVQVIDSDGLHHESGCVSVAGAQASAPIALGDAGGYVVLWQVVSSDGHPTSGQYEFDYEPISLEGAADGLTTAPVCGEAWSGAPDGTSPAPTASPSAGATAPAPVATATATADASGGAESTSATQTAVPVTDSASSLPWPIVVLIVLAGLGALTAIVLLVIRRGRSGGYGHG